MLSRFFADQACARNMGHFLTCKQYAKEAEVEEVHIEENLETTTKHFVRVFKFNNKWKDGHLWLSAEDEKMFCSYCKEVYKIKQAETNSSQAVS